MSDRARLAAAIALQEGFRPNPYKDTRGLWTFGIGRCLETRPLTGAEWKQLLDGGELAVVIGRAGADELTAGPLEQIETDLAKAYDFWPRLNDARQNALIEMAYQLGEAKEEAFHNMIAAVRRAIDSDAPADWEAAEAAGLDSEWARETPGRAQQVMKQLRTGAFQ